MASLGPGAERAASEQIRSGAVPLLGPERLHPSPKVPTLRGEVGSVLLSFIPGWKSSLPLQKPAGRFEQGGAMK